MSEPKLLKTRRVDDGTLPFRAACQAAAVVVCLPRSSASENSRVCALASGTRRLRIVDFPIPDCPTRSTVLPVKTSSSLARASSGRSDADISIVCAPIERSSAVCWSAAARPSDRSSLLRMTTADPGLMGSQQRLPDEPRVKARPRCKNDSAEIRVGG